MKKTHWIGATVFLGAMLGWLYLPTLRWLWDEWFASGNRFYSHGSLVLLISFLLVLRKRQIFVSAKPWSKGALVVLLGLALGIVALLLKLPLLYGYSLSAYSLLLLVMGLVLALCGKAVTRQLLFPLLFLALAVPLPFTNQLASFLARIVATGSVALSQAINLPIVREQILVTVGGYSYSIDELCSGLSIILAVFAIELPALYLKRYSWRRVALFLLATPIVALVFKIFLVTYVFWSTENGRAEVALGAYHGWAGILAFGLSLATILSLLVLYSKSQPRQALIEPRLSGS